MDKDKVLPLIILVAIAMLIMQSVFKFPFWITILVIIIASIIQIYRNLEKPEVLETTSTTPKIKITGSNIVKFSVYGAVIAISIAMILFFSLLVYSHFWGEESEAEIEYLHPTETNQYIISPAGTGNHKIGPVPKDTEIHFASWKLENFDWKNISFSIIGGNGYKTKVVFVKHYDKDDTDNIVVPDKFTEYPSPSSETTQKKFHQSVYCPDDAEGSFILIVYLKKGGYIEIEDLRIETWE
ncbi:MAG: hypothetical protein KAS01_00715 [Candidatus Pacebacteria bacterium]|nr:hypothetical protein [Candidatus Paceibacterota bacterium]